MTQASLARPGSPVAPNARESWPARVLAAWPAVLILIAGIAYVVLHLPTLAGESFWTDELVSVGDANQKLFQMIRNQASDIHPPFHAVVLWVLVRLTHDSTEAALRLVGLVAVSGGMVILALAAWRRVGLGAAALVLALVASSSLVAGFAAQARPHGLAFGLICVATAAWLYLLRPEPLRWRPLLLFAVAGGLAALTQYYATLVYGLESMAVLGWLALRRAPGLPSDPGPGRTGRRGELLRALAVVALSAAPVIAWLAITRQFTHPSSTPALTPAWVEEVAGWVSEPFSTFAYGVVPEARHALQLTAQVLGLAVVLLLLAAVGDRLRPRADRSSAQGLRLALGGATLALVIAALTVATVQSIVSLPTLHYRSLVSLMPVLCLGLGIAYTVPFGRWAPVVGLGLAAASGVVAVQVSPPSLYGAQDQWREAAVIVRDLQRAGLPASRVAMLEVYNSRQDWMVELNNAYLRPAPNQDLPPELRALTWIHQPADLASFPADQPLLLVAFHYWMPDLHAQVLAIGRERFGPCRDMSVTGITILRCTPGAAP